MTKLEQAARQALGALEVATTPLAKDRQEVLRAITTLREALSGVQALSAAPAVPAGWKAVPVNPTPEMWKAAKTVPDPNPPYPPHYGLVWDAMLAASPTPPAEQQAMESVLVDGVAYQTPVPVACELLRLHLELRAATTEAAPVVQPGAVYANKPDSVAWLAEYGGDVFTATQLLNFADRTHALRKQAAPKAAPGVVNSVFDHQTAADFLSGKTVSDEAVRKFVATSRWAHDERAALSATLLAMHGVLTSREAEIALLKKALLEAEAAHQQEPAAVVVPCHTPSGKRVALYSAKQDLPIGTQLYTAPQPSPITKPAPQPAPAPLSERDAFERDWEKRHAPVPINGRTHDDGRYGDSSIQDAWESWQARAS